MKVIVMGCGRTGSLISWGLQGDGQYVTVIDHDANA